MTVLPEAEAQKLERLLRRVLAAEYIQRKWGIPCSPKTLAKYAVVGGGPEFRRASRWPLYPEDGLDTWAQSRLSPRVRSTSELPKTPRAAAPAPPTAHRRTKPAKAQPQNKAEARDPA
jgi:hypothetical protein